MSKIITKPVSVLLTILMLCGVFTAVPFTAFAAPADSESVESETLSLKEYQYSDDYEAYPSGHTGTNVSITPNGDNVGAWYEGWNFYNFDAESYAAIDALNGKMITKLEIHRSYYDGTPAIVVDGETISPASQSGATYTFENFEAIRLLVKATGDYVTSDTIVVYYTDAPIYTVSWQNYDGTPLGSDQVQKHLVPSYSGEKPVRADSSTDNYVFSGWDDGTHTYALDALPVVSGDVTYTADFTAYPIHTHDGKTFRPWDSATSLPTSGSWYLLTPVRAPAASFTITDELNLCLNGQTVTLTWTTWENDYYHISVSGGTLNLYDLADNSGRITGGRHNNGGGIYVANGGTVNMYGGTITGNSADVMNGGGGGVYINGGTFNMHGGAISGNRARNYGGGGVYVNAGGTFNLYDGVISNNDIKNSNNNTNSYGGGVRVQANGTFNMSGGSITGNHANLKNGFGGAIFCGGNVAIRGGSITNNTVGSTGYGGGLFATVAGTLKMSGDPVITGNTKNGSASNVHIQYTNSQNAKIHFDGALNEGAYIGVTMYQKGAFTNGYSAANTDHPVSYFLSDENGFYVAQGDGEAHITSSVCTVTWRDEDGSTLVTDDLAAVNTTPTYYGATPTKAGNAQYTYTFAGWTPAITAVTGDVEYTAQFTEHNRYLFDGHNITLNGDIGVNFYIDPAAVDADIANADTAVVKFTWDEGNYNVEVNLKEVTPDGNGLYKATCDVPAAYMAHTITAKVYINGVEQEQTDTYSVQQYAEDIMADPSAYCPEDKDADELDALVKEMLNYGRMAQNVFSVQMNAPAVYDDIDGYAMNTDIDAEAVLAAINGEATDLTTVHPEEGMDYYTTSVIFQSENIIRQYFVKDNATGSYDGQQDDYYYYVQSDPIPAAELDELQTFNANGKAFRYSVLDYVAAVLNSGMNENAKNLVKALFLYNQAANAYFD